MMKKIDEIIFGDNQFFGINHMSQEKAQNLSQKFYDINKIFDVYDIAYDVGIRSFMLNSNERAFQICDHFKKNKSKYKNINWYPSIPYPHKYANLISEKGIVQTLNEVLLKKNSTVDILKILTKGSSAFLTKDPIKLMKMLIDIEMKIFRGLNIKVVFLQNIVTDLVLGFDIKEIFEEYCVYIRKKYDAIPGFITQNLPHLKNKLEEWGIKEIVICSSFNKIGYLMSPDINSNIETLKNTNPNDYQLMAMSTLASGAINAKSAYEFINKQNIQSVVFGASSRKNIEETFSLIDLKK